MPFTVEQFLDVFGRYNAAIWPAQVVAYVLGAAVVAALASRRSEQAGRAVGLVLAGGWAFTGVAYHLVHFSAINPVARAFAAAFVLEAALLACAAWRGRLAFGPATRLRHRVGWALVGYAVALYPLVGLAAGHGYPRAPTFGVTPCPTAIFTLGVLLLAAEPPPWWLVAVPLLWSLVGGWAALQLGMLEDLALPVAGCATAAFVVGGHLARRRTPRRQAA